jgi:PAS domain S-box-containing protein
MIVEQCSFLNKHWFKAFLSTFENSIDSIVVTSLSPKEHFLYVSKSFKVKTGYTESDLVGKSPRILQGPETDRVVIKQLRGNLNNGEEFTGQTTNYRRDGSAYIVHWFITAIRNEVGDPVAYISYQKEITNTVW